VITCVKEEELELEAVDLIELEEFDEEEVTRRVEEEELEPEAVDLTELEEVDDGEVTRRLEEVVDLTELEYFDDEEVIWRLEEVVDLTELEDIDDEAVIWRLEEDEDDGEVGWWIWDVDGEDKDEKEKDDKDRDTEDKVDGAEIMVLVDDVVILGLDKSFLADEIGDSKFDLDRPEDPDPKVETGIDPDLDELFPRGIESAAKSKALRLEAWGKRSWGLKWASRAK
jgi:hypothetical protein